MGADDFAAASWRRPNAEDALPAPTEKLNIFKMALERLTAPETDRGGGYRFIGMDHFARPDDELARAQDAGALHRNLQGYSTRAGAGDTSSWS